MSRTSLDEFKPGRAPKRAYVGGRAWLPGYVSRGRMYTRLGTWVPVEKPIGAVQRRRLWLSVILVIMIAAIAVWMGLSR